MKFPLFLAPALLVATGGSLSAGVFPNTVSPGSVPWPGGVVPYAWDASVPAGMRATYLAGLKEWELAGGVQFIERTTETDYIRLKFDAGAGSGSYSPSPPTLTMIRLARGNVCHESGHALGLEHEHSRPDRDDFIQVLEANIQPAALPKFAKFLSGDVTSFGGYDFESVMHYGRTDYSIDPATLASIVPTAGHEIFAHRLGNLALSAGDIATLTHLYGPGPTLSSVVSNTNDTGPGSLRAAIYHANSHPGTTITFAIPGGDPGHSGGVWTIRLTGSLPALTAAGTIVDATTQPGYAGAPVIELSGADIIPEAGEVSGLVIHGDHCRVRGIAIGGFSGNGLLILHPGAHDNSVDSCFFGLKADGTTAAPNAKQGVGIWGGAHDNTIGPGNVLSANGEYGVWMSETGSTGNQVTGNRIGSDAAGVSARPNLSGGVIVNQGANDATISNNHISGNNDAGIWLIGTNGNTVSGNSIGLDGAGVSALPNSFVGIYLIGGSQQNVVTGNVLSGNFSEGIRIADPGTSGNHVEANLIGTNATGSAAVPNGFAGVAVIGGAEGNVIGGAAPGCGNVISGNGGYGVVFLDSGTEGNSALGNRIGPGADGSLLGNGGYGVAFWNGSQGNAVGGDGAGEGNAIAGNPWGAIAIFDANTHGHTFSGNSIHSNGGGIFPGAGNHGQSAPFLTSATLGSTGMTISGSVTSTPDRTFRIEFFASDAGTFHDGKTFLGAVETASDGGGTAAFSPMLAAVTLPGRVITATATDLTTGDSSGFSNAIAIGGTDTDSDGMPDAYETANDLDEETDDAALDDDGDGFNNRREFLLGTDPQDGSDRFGFTAVARSSGTATLTLATAPGRVYRIDISPTLAPPGWKPWVRSVPAAGTSTVISGDKGLPAGRAFFRAVLED